MKLDKLTLLSPMGYMVEGVGNIKSPKLKRIATVGQNIFFSYLGIFTLDNKENPDISSYELVTKDINMRTFLREALNFFIEEDVEYHTESNAFTTYACGTKEMVGSINRDNYAEVVDVILQLSHIQKNEGENMKFANKIAEKLYNKLKQAPNYREKQGQDKRFELNNIISAVSAHHPSLNIVNIWELTIYQLYDQFARLGTNEMFEIEKMQVAYYGDPQNKFKIGKWYDLL